MKERFTKMHIFRMVMSVLLLAVSLGMAAKVTQAAKNSATTFVLEKTQGDVRVVSSSKEEKSVLEGMQLYRGDHQVTGAESYAWMSLDASKAIKLDENSESALKKKWFSKKLEVYSVKGKLFFNVSVPLAEDEAFNIRTSTMVTGIRGTCGWVEVSDDWKSTIYLLTGKLECLVVNPLDNGSQTITLLPGQYAEFFVFPKSEIEGEEASCGVTTKTFTKEDIPGFILEEILGNDELIQKIYEETKTEIDLRDLTPEYVQKRIKSDQEKHKKEKQEMEEKASEELTIVEKEPVWKPENIKASAVAYLLMPQKAETVQKYLNQEKYQKVVLVPGSGSEKDNTLKVDIALTTPAGKTLEAYAGVPVEVLPDYSLTVDGTAHLTKLTNEGTVTVRSANTLEIEELLVNLGVLEITESGRLVLKKTMETSGSFVNSGVVEAAPDATGDEMIRINGGKVVMLSGMISSNRHDTIMRLADGAQAEFQFAGGMITNEMEDGASILAREEDFQVTVLGTDIMGVTNTILGKGAVLEKYNAGSVFRKDERYHLIELDKVDSYPVVVANVEHGTIIAPSRVEVGAKVTLIAVPDEGYRLESLSVNNYNSKTKKVGSSVSLSAEQSFIMPSSDVIVGGSFVEIAGEPKYQVTVMRANGGSVKASATEAKAGETIQITVQNGAGHELNNLTVKDEDGNAVGVTTSGNGYAFTMPEKSVTVTPSFRTLEYNVVFYDDDERTVLNQQTILFGTIPEYKGTKPEKSTDAQYSYTFAGWKSGEATYAADARLPEVTGNTVYTAVYAKKVVEEPYVAPTTFTVTWRNWDGTELEKDTGLTNGATPSYDSTIPTRDADAEFSYDFAGWTSAFGEYGATESLPAVTGDITYTARFTHTTRKYTITWLNYNGELLETDELVPYGSMPTYDGETPEKNVEDRQYSYIFAGWDAAIVPVAGNATYKATYTQELNSYTIRFLNEDGSVMETLENVDYGTMPAYTSIPTKTGDDQYSYDFAGWNPELTTVEGDTDYTVVFTQRINKYKVIWLNEGGAPLKTQEGIEYNTIPSYPEASNPTKGTDAQYTYEFAGWKVGTTPYAIGTTLPPVQGDVTFTAYYTPTLRQFDVTFLDEDGTTPIQNTTQFDYGTLATTYAPADPTKTASGQYTYAFAGWTPDNGTTVYTKAQLPMVTDDVVYKATYTTTIHPLSVSLDAQSLDIFVGGTAATLTATITPSDAANQNVLWTSDDESVATVTGNGLTATVTAVANGTAIITVKTEDGGYEASCTVTVKTSVTGVNLDKTELTVILGTTESLQATITPATASNKNLIWTSGDNNIAFASTVGAASAADVGRVTINPVSVGTTTIKVTTEDGSFEKSCAVIVKGYTVTFVNDDDAHTQLNQQLNVAKDAIPSFAGAAQPSKTATQQYTYTFAGWKNGQATYPVGTALPAVTGDVTYTAYYDDTVNPYNVTFVGEDGASIMKAATAYDYGTLGSDIAVPATAKTSSEEFDYTFAGWIVKGSDGSVKYMTNADLPNVTDHVIYQATYTSTTRSYAIKFHYDGSDNTKVHTQQVAYGTVPVYDGTEPTKTATAQVTYVFAGWQDADGTPGLSSVTGEKEYFATFGTSGNTFAITYDLNAGTDASAKLENAVVSYVYGVGATLPTAANVTRDGYEFSGWYTTATPTANDTAITAIGTAESGAKIFYAKWTAKKYALTLTKAGNGSFSQIAVGSAITAGALDVDAGMDDPSQPVTYDYDTDQTVYIMASVFKGSVGDEITEMTAPNSISIQDADGNTITPTYADGFYSFTMPAKACTVTVTTVNYQVSIDEVANGSVTTDHDNCAEAGDTIVLDIVDVVLGYEFGGFTFKNDADENVTIATTKVNDSQYTFTMPAYNVTVEPAFKLKTFTITFVDEDGTTVLKEATTYEFGTPAADIATPDDPTKEDDADYHYTFNGWTPALTDVTTNQTYKATYKATAIVHVTGVSLNKTAIAAIVDGDPVEISAIIAPEAAENQNVTWSIPEADAAIASVESSGNLTAQVTGLTNGNTTLTVTTADGGFTATVPVTVTTAVSGLTLNKTEETVILEKTGTLTATIAPTTASNQTIVWESSDPTVVEIVATATNKTITLNPKKAGTATITAKSQENETIKAECAITVKGYTVTWVNDDENNTVLLTETNVAYGKVPSYSGEAMPTKEKTDQYTYSFKGWKIGTQEYPNDGTTGLPGITGDTTLQAYYTPVIRQYNVTFVGEDGTSVLKEATAYNYNTLGSAIVEPSAPTKQSSDTTTYTFAGWTVANSETVYESGHLPNVTKEVTYIAKYTEADRLYTVTFYDSAKNGSTKLYETTTTYQGHVTYQGEEPTQEEDDTYVYRFNGWIYNNYDLLITDVPSISVIEDINYTAYYNSILKGLFYDITYDGENNSPVLHLYGLKEDHLWHTLDDEKLDSAEYRDRSNNYVKDTITKVVIEDEIHPTSMENAFADCYNLVAIENIENLKTDKVTSMEGAFKNCMSLESIDLSGFNTSNVTTMKEMFSHCSNYELKSLDLRSFDTSKVTDLSSMFEVCTGLETLYVNGLVTENAEKLDRMFFYCSGLTSLDVSSFDTKNVTSMSSMFEYCGGLTSLDVSNFDTSNVKNMSLMFNECAGLTSLNVSGWNTSNVTDMHTMFGNMRQIEALDLSSFNTANVENMGSMFRMDTEWSSLQTIFASEDFVTTKVSESSSMFYNCTNLVGGQGTAFAQDPHTDAEYARIDIPAAGKPGYFTDKTQLAKRIFYKLAKEGGETVLRLSATPATGYSQIMGAMLNSSQYTNVSGETALGSSDITKVIIEEPIYPANMYSAFYNCIALKEIQNIEYLNTQNVTSMQNAFRYTALTTLDLSGFDTSNVTNMASMFANTPLKTIYASENFVVTGLTDAASHENMFANCSSLIGGLGTRYCLYGEGVCNPADKTYAWMDGRDGKKGYFTGKDIVDPSSIYYQFTLNDGTTNEYTLHFYGEDGTNRTRLAGGVMHNMSYVHPELDSRAYTLTAIKIEEPIVPSDMAYAFASMTRVTSLVGLDKIDTKNVTSMDSMFVSLYGNTSELDLSTWDLSNVTSMNHMFSYCDATPGIKLKGATNKLTNTSYMFYHCDALTTLELSSFDTSNVTNMDSMFYGCSSLTEIDLQGISTASVTNMSNMFSGCENATTINVSSFNTSNVKYMSYMFSDCISLTSLDLSSFDTSNVTSAYMMFAASAPDYNLRAIFASDQFVATAALEENLNGGDMFLNRYSLAGGAGTVYDANNITYTYAKLDGGRINPGYFTDVAMYGKEGLYYSLAEENGEVVLRLYNKYVGNMTEIKNKELNSSAYVSGNLDKTSIQKVVIMDEIKPASVVSAFEGCYRIESIEGLDKLDITGITDMSNMFKGCTNLKELDLSSFDTAGVTKMNNLFYGCYYLVTIYASDAFVTTNVTDTYDEYGYPNMFERCECLVGGAGTMHQWLEATYNPDDKEMARIDGTFDGTHYLPGYFTDKNATPEEIYYDIKAEGSDVVISFYANDDTGRELLPYGSLCSYMYSMNGYQPSDVTKVNFVDEIHPTNMTCAFNEMPIQSFENFDNLKTDKVMNLGGAFKQCGFSGVLDLRKWNTSNVTSIHSMFYEAYNLTGITLTGLDLSRVTSMESTFEGCSSLKTIDLSNLDTSKVTTFYSLFEECEELKSVNFTNFDTSSATNMARMFHSCYKLASMDLRGFDTSNVTNMWLMFYECTGLTTLDLSSFDTSKVTNMSSMFETVDSDYKLTTIYVSDKFDVSNVSDGSNMFENRQNLEGGLGTVYDAGKTDKEYARIDGGSAAPGYFTERTALGIITLSGNVARGETLTVTVTDTDANAGTIKYEWQRIDVDGNATTIQNETNNTYVITNDDDGCLLACVVTATNTPDVRTVVTKQRVSGEDKLVTFDVNLSSTNAASNQPGYQTVRVGELVVEPSFPEFIDGYAFNGWYSDVALTKKWDFMSNAVGDNLTLYAKWNDPIYWRVANNTLYLQSSDANGAKVLENQHLDNANPTAPWFDTAHYDKVNHVVIVDDIYPTYMTYWWYDPDGSTLTDITGLEKIHTEDVVDMSGLFVNAIMLNPNTLDLSHFNTSKVQKMISMFQGLGSDLPDDTYYLDLSSFDTSNVKQMNYMFADMNLVQAIFVSDSFVTSGLEVTAAPGDLYMFSNCTNLKGEKGTSFDYRYINSEYAKIDEGWWDKGYFSRKPEMHTIHVQYLDGYGGTTGDAIWTASANGAQDELKVNGLDNTTLQAHKLDSIYLKIDLWSGYEFEEDPLGSNGQRDDIYSGNYDYASDVYSANGYASFEFVMPDEDVWIYVKTQKKADTEEGSITTYYKVWNNAANDYTLIPSGGTLTAYDENGNVVDSVARGDTVTLQIEPMAGYQLSKVKAVYWDVNAAVSYEFGVYGGDEIKGITIDPAMGIGTVDYEITEFMDGKRLILEATFQENMEYAVQLMPGIMDGRTFVSKSYVGSITATVGGNAVKKVKTGEEVELTVTPAQNYRLIGFNAAYTDGTDARTINLLQSKTEENKYSFKVESVYFSSEETPSIVVMGIFKYGYDVQPLTVAAGGSFSLSVGGNAIGQGVAAGDTVTILASPNEGLTVDQVTVLNVGGGRVDVSKATDAENVYTFTMPEGDVTVKVTFKAATAGTTVDLTGNQTVSSIQNYLNMAGVSEVRLNSISGNSIIAIDNDLVIPEGKTLVVEDEVLLQIYDGQTLIVNAGGLLNNYGQIFNKGTIQGLTDTSSSGFENHGILFSRGTLDFTGSTIENYGEFYATTMPSGTFTNYYASGTVISTSEEVVGSCGDWAGYAVLNSYGNYEVRIVGTGSMNDFSSTGMPWNAIKANVRNIIVYDGITYVSRYAFYNHTGLSMVKLPASVDSIGNYAFEGCTNLTKVELPAGLTYLGLYAFGSCGVTSVTYPGAPTEPGIYLPPSLEEVPSYCFYGCPLAEKVVISEGTTQIANNAFDGTGVQGGVIKEVWLPKSLQKVSAYAFLGRDDLATVYYSGTAAQWANLTLNISDAKLLDAATEVLFYNYVSDLQIVENANGTVTAKVDGATATTAMGGKTVQLVITADTDAERNIVSVKTASGATVEVAADDTFEMPCENVVINVTFLAQAVATEFTGSAEQLQGVLNANDSVKLTSNLTLTENLSIPAGKTLFVMDGATLTIPNDVRVKIEENAILCNYGTISNHGDLLNKGQISIQGTFVNETDGAIGNDGRIDGNYVNNGVIGVPVAAGAWQYYQMTAKDLTIFGEGALPDYDNDDNPAPWKKQTDDTIETVTIRKGITSIGNDNFYYIRSIKSISIPNDVTSIGRYAFCGTAIETFSIPDSVTTLGSGVFNNCGSLTTVTLGKGITSIPDYTFAYCGLSGTFNIDSAITSIGSEAFISCHALTEVNFAADCNITEWGYNIFEYCSGLEKVELPVNMTEIPYDMFLGCSNLKEITIPESVTIIYSGAFCGCEALEKITIPANVEYISESAFSGCYALTEVTLSESLTTIMDYAFNECTSLTQITLPENVSYIGEYAFSECTSLKTLYVSKKISSVKKRAFYGTILTDIYFDGTREEWAEVEDMFPSGITAHCSDDNNG